MVHAPRLSALCCGLFALCCSFTPKSNAENFTQTGNFGFDNQVVEVPITTTTTQTYNFFTTSYAGGLNADGTTTGAGGFDPVLSLFNSDGTLFAGNAVSNGGADANLIDVLGPGMYTLVLSEFPDYSGGTIGSYTGIGSIVSDACGTSTPFTDAVDCSARTSAYSVNYTSTPVTSSAVTPEPPSALLLFLPLGGVVVLNRRRLLSGTSH